MATPYHLSVVTPEKVFFSGETTQITTRLTEGDIGILAGHTSLVSSLPSGALRILQEDGSWRVAAISSGILKVGREKTTILANAAEWADEIDLERAKASEKNARERIKQGKEERDIFVAELKLQRALNRISVKSSLE